MARITCELCEGPMRPEVAVECFTCGRVFCTACMESHVDQPCDFTGLMERLGGFTYEDLAEERIRKLAS